MDGWLSNSLKSDQENSSEWRAACTSGSNDDVRAACRTYAGSRRSHPHVGAAYRDEPVLPVLRGPEIHRCVLDWRIRDDRVWRLVSLSHGDDAGRRGAAFAHAAHGTRRRGDSRNDDGRRDVCVDVLPRLARVSGYPCGYLCTARRARRKRPQVRLSRTRPTSAGLTALRL